MNAFEIIFLCTVAYGIYAGGWRVVSILLTGVMAVFWGCAVQYFVLGDPYKAWACVGLSVIVAGVSYGFWVLPSRVAVWRDKAETKKYKEMFNNPGPELKRALERIKEL